MMIMMKRAGDGRRNDYGNNFPRYRLRTCAATGWPVAAAAAGVWLGGTNGTEYVMEGSFYETCHRFYDY